MSTDVTYDQYLTTGAIKVNPARVEPLVKRKPPHRIYPPGMNRAQRRSWYRAQRKARQ